MNVLVIIADCITRNSSANLCHLAYIRGLINAGHKVTLISSDGRDYDVDKTMCIPKEVDTYFYYAVSCYEKLSLKKKNLNRNTVVNKDDTKLVSFKTNWTKKIIRKFKNCLISFYGPHGIYAKFVKIAQKFKSDEIYDYVLSISEPPASHLLAYKLIKSKNIKYKHWIQIWEDPWYADIYGINNNKKVFEEERKLLSYAENVCYVSPLTLINQQKLFPENSHKMYWQPLPFYYSESNIKNDFIENVYGYFGDYAPITRNLTPFYNAAKEMNINVNICGNPNNLFESTDTIHIYPRLTLDKLKMIEEKTNILIFLCNKKGGQIPGKIYQYSSTTKTILFILDGTVEEKKVLREFFEPYNRYIFCENTVEDIKKAIAKIQSNDLNDVKNISIADFNPDIIIDRILKCGDLDD